MNSKLINVFIDEKPSKVPLGYTIMQSCAQAGVDVPRFCYHDKLLIAGNCRICLVELTGSKKLLASCAVHISDNAYIYTNTARVKLARQNVLEFLLANHPLDCPICDQGGECDLQDITAVFGADRGRFYESAKRAVLNKDFGPLIRTSMNRCIHCTRCVRFLSMAAGMSVLGTLGRGTSTEISAYVDRFLHDELSGNITDLCPVGALTSKPYSFKARPWELISTEGIDVFDALNSTLSVDVAANKISRILPYANDALNSGWLTNRARYAYDGVFFQRLSSCLLQVKYLNLVSPSTLVLSRFTRFFIKISLNSAIAMLLNKFYATSTNCFYFESGVSLDLETVAAVGEFASLLGARIFSPLTEAGQYSLQEFTNIFLFNTSLLELAKMPSFIFFLGTNPRLESPLVNLKLTSLQSEFATPFYRIGASLAYYNYGVKLISNSIRTFFEICEFKHAFCKNFYQQSFSINPLFLLGAQLVNSYLGVQIVCGVLALIRRIRYNVFGQGINRTALSEFSSFNVLGLYSGWIHALDFSTNSLVLEFRSNFNNFAQAALLKRTRGSFLYYNVNAGSSYLSQCLPALSNIWSVFQGSHGGSIAGFADLVFPTTTYMERTAIYRNLLGVAQKSLPAILYSRALRTDREVFLEILGVLGKSFFNRFFSFNFQKAITYNVALNFENRCFDLLVQPNTFAIIQNELAFDLTRNKNDNLTNFFKAYYYTLTYWSYFSYTWRLKAGRSSYLTHLLALSSGLRGKKIPLSPIASSLVNYYSDASLPILTASKAMNACSSLYLKKNLSVLQLHL